MKGFTLERNRADGVTNGVKGVNVFESSTL